MTIAVANTGLTNTPAHSLARVSELAYAMSTKVVTTDSNTATGNAAIGGTFTAARLVANGLNISSNATVNITNTVITWPGIVSANIVTPYLLVNTIASAFTQSIDLVVSNAATINAASIATLTGNSFSMNVGSAATMTGNVFTINTLAAIGFTANTANVANNITVGYSLKLGNVTILVPNSTYANGSYYLNGNGSWTSISTSVPGSNQQGIFNDSGSLNATADFTFNKTTKSIYVANAIQLGTALIQFSSTNTSSNASQTIDSVNAAAFRSVEYFISVKNNDANGYQCSKLIVTHNGGTALVTEYAVLSTNATLATFSATANSTVLALNAVPVSSNSYTFSIEKHCITV